MTFLSCQSEERAQFEILKAQMFAERAAKRERRPKRARAMPEEEEPSKGEKSDQRSKQPKQVVDHLVNRCRVSCLCTAAKQKTSKGGKKSAFDKELTNTSRKSLKNYRAG